jgi:hypothetical protein
MNNADKPAFSKSAFYHPDGGIDAPQEGLTKREYFAGLAMQGLVSSPNYSYDADSITKDSAIIADALLKQLEQPTNE